MDGYIITSNKQGESQSALDLFEMTSLFAYLKQDNLSLIAGQNRNGIWRVSTRPE